MRALSGLCSILRKFALASSISGWADFIARTWRVTPTTSWMGAASLNWGIIGVGLMPGDIRMQEVLIPQDCLYTLVERQDKTEAATVIGSVCGVLFAGDSSQAALHAIVRRQPALSA
jgi:hypothetical protein